MESRVVLALDDDKDILRVLSAALDAEGFQVKTAVCRADFEVALNRYDPDVVLLDVRLSDGNGMAIARDLRLKSSVGIILVTGQADTIDRVLGLELGADDFVAKPFNLRELRARVNAVYRRTALIRRLPAPNTPGALRYPAEEQRTVHGITIAIAARRVTDATGSEIDLTSLEFELLSVLSRNVNRALSRDQIMDHIRGSDWAAYDRTIDGLVCRLRRKLFPDGSGGRKIRTIRGVGYLLSIEP
jgi:DNA-binding response OmpR family regulator